MLNGPSSGFHSWRFAEGFIQDTAISDGVIQENPHGKAQQLVGLAPTLPPGPGQTAPTAAHMGAETLEQQGWVLTPPLVGSDGRQSPGLGGITACPLLGLAGPGQT